MSQIRPLEIRLAAAKRKVKRLQVQSKIRKLKKEARDLRKEEFE